MSYKTDKGAEMQTFPHKVGEKVEGTTFLAIATSWEYPTNLVILANSDMSGYYTFWWDMEEGSDFNTTYHDNSEDAGHKFINLAFGA